MKADDELCLCFHVTRRKVEQYLRARRPAVASQLSECYGAGTGCGWCRPFLQRLHAQVLTTDRPVGETAAGRECGGSNDASKPLADALPDATRYAAERAAYRRNRSASPAKE